MGATRIPRTQFAFLAEAYKGVASLSVTPSPFLHMAHIDTVIPSGKAPDKDPFSVPDLGGRNGTLFGSENNKNPVVKLQGSQLRYPSRFRVNLGPYSIKYIKIRKIASYSY